MIVPTYFRAHDLSELLDSILRQTVKPFEVIVVDDNTPNDGVKIVCDNLGRFSENLASTSSKSGTRGRLPQLLRGMLGCRNRNLSGGDKFM